MEPKNELQRNAFAEARRTELETFQRALDIQWLNSRMEDGRMGRCLAQIRREAEMEKDFQQRTDHAAIVNAKAEREAALGVEIAKLKHDQDVELLRRHYLREKDPGLRELAKKLQAGYVCRDLKQQILHNQYRRLQEKAEDKAANNFILNSLLTEKDKAQEKLDHTTQYCKELQQQLVNRQLQKQCQYEETLIEKKMLEEVMRTLADEDQRELKQKRDLMEKTRNEMVTFQKAREAWRLKHKQMVIKEETQIEEQKKMVADRSSAIIAEKQRRQRIKDEINEGIVAKKMAAEAAIQERANQIKLLQEQECLEKNFQDDIANREKLERIRKDTKESLTAQMENRKKIAEDMKQRDLEFRRTTEAKLAADLAQEQEKQNKKRMQGKLYSQELLKQIEANKRKKQLDAELENRTLQYIKNYDKKWFEEVAEERKKMIAEHVPPVLGYLQAGVVKKDDLPVVREGANRREELAKLDIEAMAISNRPKRFPKCNAQCMILREF